MNADLPGLTSGARTAGVRGRLLLALDLVGAAVALGGLLNLAGRIAAGIGQPCDFTAYYLAGRAHLLGLDYYQQATLEGLAAAAGLRGDLGPFLYPPLFAAAVAPLAALPYPMARSLWFVFGLVALGAALLLLKNAARLPVGPGLRGIALAFAVFFPPTFDDLLKGQVTTLLLLLLAGAWLALVRARPTLAGALVAVAASVKLAPALFLVYFVLRHQHRALAAGVASGAGLVAASLLLGGVERHLAYLSRALPDASLQVGATANVSLPGLFARLFAPVSLTPALWPSPLASTVAAPSALLVVAFIYWRFVRAEAATDKAYPGFTATVLVMLLAMPSAQAYALTLVFVPLAWALAACLAARPPRWRLLDLVVVAAIMLAVPPDLKLAPEFASALGVSATPRGALGFAISAMPTVGLLLLGSAVLGAFAANDAPSPRAP
ncbi:MAG: glycosyltransferase family 87 protein [Chloroflexota bacterium]